LSSEAINVIIASDCEAINCFNRFRKDYIDEVHLAK
jgi:hypothetical protein